MVCLETDFIVDLLRKRDSAIEKLRELSKTGSEMTITPITATEIFEGAFASEKKEKIEKAEQLILGLRILRFDFFAAREAGGLLSLLVAKGQKIGDFDALTAAIALRHGEKTIITKNKKHFGKIKGLVVETW